MGNKNVSGILLFLISLILYTLNKSISGVLDRMGDHKPLNIYDNFYNDRKKIYKEFKGNKKGYIYAIVNKLNGKCYVGSTRSIVVRLYNYFNLKLLEVQKRRPISSAILKYGLVNFAFILIEEVNLELHNLEERETYWIKKIKPEYNAIKEAARNFSVPHLLETKFKISINRSRGVLYIYDEYKNLLAIVPSISSLALALGSSAISISIKRAIENKVLFRSSWYISKQPFNENENPSIELSSPEYLELLNKMKAQKHIRKAIFVFKDGVFLRKYDGIMEAEKDLKISHDTINSNIEKNTTYKGYRFSLHRVD